MSNCVGRLLRDYPRLSGPGRTTPSGSQGCFLDERSVDVWFIARIPGATTAGHAKTNADVEGMLTISPGDVLCRRMLAGHGFKEGACESSGGAGLFAASTISPSPGCCRGSPRTLVAD
jgi:hypothetical protein